MHIFQHIDLRGFSVISANIFPSSFDFQWPVFIYSDELWCDCSNNPECAGMHDLLSISIL